MPSRSHIAVVVSFAILVTGAAGIGGAASYEVSVVESLDTPTRTVTVAGEDYEVSSVGRVELGDSVIVETSVPQQGKYNVYLYNTNLSVMTFKTGQTSDSFSFSFPSDDYSPGTYVFTLQHDGKNKAIQPIVVQGFDFSITAPSNAEAGDDVNVIVDITRTAGSKSVDAVEVAIINDSTSVTTELTKTGSGSYEGTISLSEFDPGTYRLYSAVRGTQQAFGKNERLAVSDASTFEIESTSTPTPQPSSPDSSEDESEEESAGGAAGGGAGGIGRVVTDKPTTTPSTPDTEISSPTVQSPTNTRSISDQPSEDNSDTSPQPIDDQSDVDRSTDPQSTPQDPSTDSSVITPASEQIDNRATSSPTESPGQDGFGIRVGILILVATLLLSLRRSDGQK